VQQLNHALILSVFQLVFFWCDIFVLFVVGNCEVMKCWHKGSNVASLGSAVVDQAG